MYKKILLAVDDSDAAELALAQAVTVAKAMSAEVKSLFVVTQALGSTLTPAEAATAAIGKRILEHVRSKMEANGLHYSTELLEEAVSAAGDEGVGADVDIIRFSLKHSPSWSSGPPVSYNLARTGCRRILIIP